MSLAKGNLKLVATLLMAMLECWASTLLLDVQKETHCLVRFGKSFESRYTMFVQQKDIITHHDHAFAFVLPIELPEPSPSGDERVIQPTVSYCIYLCFPVFCVLSLATYCETCQPPGRSITTQRPLDHTGEMQSDL